MGNYNKIGIHNVSMLPADTNNFLGCIDPLNLKSDTISLEFKEKEGALKAEIKSKLLWEMVYSKNPPEKLEIVVVYEDNSSKKFDEPFKEKYNLSLDDTVEDVRNVMNAVEDVSTVTANKIMQDILYHLVIENNLFAQ